MAAIQARTGDRVGAAVTLKIAKEELKHVRDFYQKILAYQVIAGAEAALGDVGAAKAYIAKIVADRKIIADNQRGFVDGQLAYAYASLTAAETRRGNAAGAKEATDLVTRTIGRLAKPFNRAYVYAHLAMMLRDARPSASE